MAISVALPAFAQRSIPDPQLREKVVAAIKKHIAALDKNDAAAGAANFTENGILVTPDGSIFGRESIEKYYEGEFKQVNWATISPRSMMILLTGWFRWQRDVGNRKMECICINGGTAIRF